MDAILIFKLLSTPVIIGLSVAASKRWGPFVGGCIAGLPSISGPISFFLALELGADYAAAVVHNALLGVGAVCLFTLAYAWVSPRKNWCVALLAAQCMYFFTGWLVGFIPHITWLAVAVGLAGPPLTIILMPRRAANAPLCERPQPRWLVPTQMLLGSMLVLCITAASTRIGVHWSGILTFYPVMISILAPFYHASLGAQATRQLLSGLMTGFVGGTSFMVVVLFGVQKLPLAVCYTLSTLLSLLLCMLVGMYQQKRAKACTCCAPDGTRP